MRASTWPDAWLAPVDRVRRAVLAVAARASRPLVAAREPRVAFAATLAVLVAFVGTAVAPTWLLLASPILLGVPHVVSDVRYLVARPGVHRRPAAWLAIGGPLVWCAFGGGVRAGLVATCGALIIARGSRLVRATGIALAFALFAIATSFVAVADLAFAHLHNFIAVALWLAWRRRARSLHAIPIAVFVVACALLLSGVGSVDFTQLPYTAGEGLVPLELSAIGGRLVALYAFAQALHYAVWLRLVPEEDRAQPTPRTFASSWRALAKDVGPWVIVGATVATLGFIAYAFFDLASARDSYLRAAIFHGHLELAAAALLFVEGRLPVGATHAITAHAT